MVEIRKKKKVCCVCPKRSKVNPTIFDFFYFVAKKQLAICIQIIIKI